MAWALTGWSGSFPPQTPICHARLINADGSEAEISGNGTRCVAAYMVSNGHSGKVAISTGAGVKHCDLVSREEHSFEFEMEMGKPQVGSEFSMTGGVLRRRMERRFPWAIRITWCL